MRDDIHNKPDNDSGNSFVVFTVDNASNSQQLCMKSFFRNCNRFLFTQPLRCFIFYLANLLFAQNLDYPIIFSSAPGLV